MHLRCNVLIISLQSAAVGKMIMKMIINIKRYYLIMIVVFEIS